MTPSRPEMLCGSFDPQPYPIEIDKREIVFQVDSGADRNNGLQDPLEDRVVGVVLRRIVRGQKRSAIEKQSVGYVSRRPTKQLALVACPMLGPHLREVLRSGLHVPQSRLVRKMPVRRTRSGGSVRGRFVSGPRRLCDALLRSRRDGTTASDRGRSRRRCRRKCCGRRRRRPLCAVSPALVVPAAREHADRSSMPANARAFGSATSTAAGPTIVGRLVRVVEARRPVSHDDDEPRKAVRHAHIFQHSQANGDHLVDRITQVSVFRPRGGLRTLDQLPSDRRRLYKAREKSTDTRGRGPREQHVGDQRDRSQATEDGGDWRLRAWSGSPYAANAMPFQSRGGFPSFSGATRQTNKRLLPGRSVAA